MHPINLKSGRENQHKEGSQSGQTSENSYAKWLDWGGGLFLNVLKSPLFLNITNISNLSILPIYTLSETEKYSRILIHSGLVKIICVFIM